jgi:hypothetical protein
MKFHLCKQTRLYDGEPYCGPTSDHKPMEFNTLQEARIAVIVLNNLNPTGWNIWDSETHKLVEGFDFHSGEEK